MRHLKQSETICLALPSEEDDDYVVSLRAHEVLKVLPLTVLPDMIVPGLANFLI